MEVLVTSSASNSRMITADVLEKLLRRSGRISRYYAVIDLKVLRQTVF
jgi:hypothetical protein